MCEEKSVSKKEWELFIFFFIKRIFVWFFLDKQVLSWNIFRTNPRPIFDVHCIHLVSFCSTNHKKTQWRWNLSSSLVWFANISTSSGINIYRSVESQSFPFRKLSMFRRVSSICNSRFLYEDHRDLCRDRWMSAELPPSTIQRPINFSWIVLPVERFTQRVENSRGKVRRDSRETFQSSFRNSFKIERIRQKSYIDFQSGISHLDICSENAMQKTLNSK